MGQLLGSVCCVSLVIRWFAKLGIFLTLVGLIVLAVMVKILSMPMPSLLIMPVFPNMDLETFMHPTTQQ